MRAQKGTIDQSKKKTQRRKLHVSCQRAWFALLFSFANCSTRFSPGLGALPVFSSPWQVSHRFDISFHFHSFTQWLFWDSKQDSLSHTWSQWLSFTVEEDSTIPLLLYPMTPKPEPHSLFSQGRLSHWNGTWPLP